jgi:hypothetical protein
MTPAPLPTWSTDVTSRSFATQHPTQPPSTGKLTSRHLHFKGDFDFLDDILGVQEGKENLLSVSHECNAGKIVVFTSAGVKVYAPDDVTITGLPQYEGSRRSDGLWHVSLYEPASQPADTPPPSWSTANNDSIEPDSIEAYHTSLQYHPERSLLVSVTPDCAAILWHNRLNHCNVRTLKDMASKASIIDNPIRILKKDWRTLKFFLCS